MSAPAIVIVGGGGHASCLADFARALGWTVLGYVAPEQGRLSALGILRLGGDEVRELLIRDGRTAVLLGVAGATSNEARSRLFGEWRKAGFTFPQIVHPAATVSPWARRGGGLQCFPGAVVNAGAVLGENVIVNSNATVEHDCMIADHAHIAPGATLCGGVSVGERTLIGAGAVVLPGVQIGRGVLVGAGSVVTRTLKDDARVAGSPARVLALRRRETS